MQRNVKQHTEANLCLNITLLSRKTYLLSKKNNFYFVLFLPKSKTFDDSEIVDRRAEHFIQNIVL